MPRLSSITTDTMTAPQHRLFDAITGGKRGVGRPIEDFLMPDGGMRGPFNAWLHHPEVGEAAQRMGEMLRFEGSLPASLRELIILTVGRHWRAQYEWWAHAKIAQKEGLADDIIQAVYDGTPLPSDNPQTLATHAFTQELVETREVSDDTYAQAREVLDEREIVEVVMLAGYYSLISATLNAFQIPLPDGETAPFGK